MKDVINKTRIESIDVVRGLDMLGIILLDQFFRALNEGYPTSLTYEMARQFEHPNWTGNTIYDIIMPLFLFTVGAVIPFALSYRIQQTRSRNEIYRKIIRRFFILFALGWVVQGNLLEWDIDRFRIFSNTLQAIAVGYLFSCFVYLNLNRKVQYIIFGACLVILTILFTLIPVPGDARVQLLPEHNFPLYVDRLIFGRFDDQTQYTWLLSSFGFIATTLSGMFAGEWIKSDLPKKKIIIRLVLVGLAGVILGELGGIWHPIIKKLWTSTFVLASSGICFLLLAFFYYLIDYKGWRKWSFPLKIIGMNAITAYVVSHVVRFPEIADYFLFGLQQYVGPFYGVLRVTGGFLLLYLMLWYMYKNRTFIRI